MSEKHRLDVELVRRGLIASRTRAQTLIEGGAVRLNGAVVQKTSALCGDDDRINIEKSTAFVGRGGEKLRHALSFFQIDVHGITAIDIGASTGGFADCLLNFGAARVFAVDVGTGQLAQTLKADPRVVSMEDTDIRALSPSALPEGVTLAVCDVSFISLRLVLPKIREILPLEGQAVVLVKPQFEAGRGRVGKNGVVKDKKVHADVLAGLLEYVNQIGFTCLGITESPIKGGSGNIEFLMHLSYTGEPWQGDILQLVRLAHERLAKV